MWWGTEGASAKSLQCLEPEADQVVKIINCLHLHVSNIDHPAAVQFFTGEAGVLIDRRSARWWLANAAMHHVVTSAGRVGGEKKPPVLRVQVFY